MSNSKNKVVHKCDENWYDDIRVLYQKINQEEWSWIIEYTWRAKENEVEDGIAEEVGNIIMMDMLLISYCPFCGCKLIDIKENTW